MDTIEYKIKEASGQDIFLHLKKCSKYFIPPLEERIDLEAYSEKIHEKATTFEAWNGSDLVGLIAVYYNPAGGFITNVSVTKEWMGTGVASVLIDNCIAYSAEKNSFELDLEVNQQNILAVNFYKRYQFEETGIKENNLQMKLKIKH